MPSTTQKKNEQTATPTPATASPTPAIKQPDLIAYHAVPAPPGAQPVFVPIGGAVAHEDGEGFTLQLNLLPTNGGRIVLRAPKAKKETPAAA